MIESHILTLTLSIEYTTITFDITSNANVTIFAPKIVHCKSNLTWEAAHRFLQISPVGIGRPSSMLLTGIHSAGH
jgi:hypothetical protein